MFAVVWQYYPTFMVLAHVANCATYNGMLIADAKILYKVADLHIDFTFANVKKKCEITLGHYVSLIVGTFLHYKFQNKKVVVCNLLFTF